MEEEEIWELEFEKILGNGSFGIVYLIRDSKDDRRYAVKRINFQGQESERKAAKKEADILSRVSHDSILNYIESFEDEECLNIVTEYCDGGDLEVYIKQREGKKLPEVRICHWIHQIASGLKYLHDNKILHRDLKTKNVFLMGDLSLKLGDLGIAKLLELNQSKAESFVGTPAYMSPELFKHLPYNHKSDIWSFGCCCYEMVALKKAFGSDEGLFALCKKVCSSERPAFPRAYSESLKSLVYSMLEEVPECRPSATDVFTNPYIKRNLAKSIYKSDSPERGSKEEKLTTQKSGIRSRPQSSARERRRQREEFRKSRTFSGEWKHIKQQIQLDKLEKKSVTKTVEKMRKLKLSSHKSESETTSDSCHSNDEDDSTFVNGGTTIIEKVRKYNSRTVGSYFDLEDPDSTLGSNESQGHNGFDLDPNVAAKQMVQNMRNNLTPFETVNTTQDEVFDTTETERATNQKQRPKKKRKILSKMAVEKKKSESTSSADTGLGMSEDISSPESQNGSEEVRLFTHGQHVTFSRHKENGAQSQNGKVLEKYVPFDKKQTTESVKGVMALVGSHENESVCMDLISQIQLELAVELGGENFQRCHEAMGAVKDDQIVKALLVEIIGQTKFDQCKEKLSFLRELELNSQAQ